VVRITYPTQLIAISAVRESNSQSWQVELQCPQCGAPLVLEESDRILACSFCRVRLYMDLEGPFRYCLMPRGKLHEGTFYVPYWRFKGMLFSMDREGVSERYVDANLLALDSPCFPASLGVRPQALPLRHVTTGIGGKFLRPDFQFQGLPPNRGALTGFSGSAVPGRAPPAKAFIGDMVSLIYSPFEYKGGVLFDAILDRPTASSPETPPEDWPFHQEAASQVQFIPMLCPTCGWDLEGERNAVVLLCRNCDSAWQANAGSLGRIDFAFPVSIDEGSLYLPFWRIQASVSGIQLKSYADWIRLANLPKAVQRQWEEQSMAFWIPAFKIQPQLFLRLIRIFSGLQPSQSTQDTIPRASLYPVTLPLAEAVESIRVALVALAAKRELLLANLSKILIEVELPSLVYFPFVRRGSELIQPAMQVSVNANALNWGELL